MIKLRVLVGCESSGVVREAFRALGHDAWSNDILPADDDSEFHIKGDVREAACLGWDLGIFHPPCTRLCNSGVRWLHERDLWAELDEAVELFKACLDAPIDHVAVENPRMHKHATERIGVKAAQAIQPWEFGDGETKETRLWLRNLPPLMSTGAVEGREQRVWKLPPSKDRWKQRSKTYEGIAKAMADQWSAFVLAEKERKAA